MKIRPVGAELFQTNRRKEEQIDGQTDRHGEINSRFWQFWERAQHVSSVLREKNLHRQVCKTGQQEERWISLRWRKKVLLCKKVKVDGMECVHC